mmetsp:Transcript_63873/g.101237  ORF Transcript_63873/g.101237 Transcript_63873/m.101237 type:complete len:227 (+) Transcript_63873:63-743(+)
MAWQTLSNLPVNIKHPDKTPLKELTFHSLPGSKFHAPPPPEDDELTLKSLRITEDPRMKAIRHYRDHAKDNTHFAHLLNHGATFAPKEATSEGLTFTDIANMETKQESAQMRTNQYSLQERVDWQESFDKSVTRLMVDFDLTHEPGCRLNHLDRMSKWFVDHGGKQQRKARKAPSYLVADRTGKLPPGSTANLAGKLSGTSQLLAGSYQIGRRNKYQRADGSQSAR